MGNLSELLKKEKVTIEKYLDFYLESLHIQGVLHDAMKYSLSAGGKRLRPFLAIAVSQLLGKSRELVMPYACALEFIHTFSLIHDDLPALDNDDLRRGKPSNHKVFGEDIAILAGDALNSDAFSVLFEFGKGNFQKGGRFFARAVGGRGIGIGQTKDCTIPEGERTVEVLDDINYYKTAMLLIAATAGAAAWLDASDAEIAALDEYGRHIGLAFQITDDILDVTSTPEELGKGVGVDAMLHKATYPALIGIERSRKVAAQHVDSAVKSLEVFGKNDWRDTLCDVATYILGRSN